MLVALNASEVGLLIGAITSGLVAVLGAFFAGMAMLRSGHVETKIDAVHHEVKTFNELTLGQLGERTETRRINEIEPIDRTNQEDRHLAMDTLDPHTRGIEKSITDRKQGGEPGTAKAENLNE